MTAELTFDLRQLEQLRHRIKGLTSARQRDLLEGLGGEIEDQVVARIESSGPAPNGEAWPEWSEDYAQTRGPGKSLLRDEGELLTSIQFIVSSDDELEVGSNLEYAATHQYGDDDRSIKARPFLGLSIEDENTVEAFALEFLRKDLLARGGLPLGVA